MSNEYVYRKIQELVQQIREAYLGVEVRDSIADSIEAMNEKTTSLNTKQNKLEANFNAILGLEGHTDFDVIKARTKADGTVFDSLKDRLLDIDATIANLNITEILDSLKEAGYINYEMYGAVGDGVTDDSAAVLLAHETANELHLPVRANGSKSYRIKSNLNIPVKTNTDWSGAELIFEEDGAETVANVFEILPTQEAIPVKNVSGIVVNSSTTEIPALAGFGLCLVDIKNENKKHFIRKGSNADSGRDQTEQFLIDNTGKILSPIYFNFDSITSITLYLTEKEIISVGNARIKTIETSQSGTEYIQRGIVCKRSNTVIHGINHTVVESRIENPAPARGIIQFRECANVVLKDSIVSSRRQYNDTGTYEIFFNKVVNATMENVIDNYMLDTNRWGCHCSNYLKNLVVRNCQLSRLDAHKGVWGIDVRNTILGHQGLRLVGGGDLILENIITYGVNLIAFRSDYGSTWLGRVFVKNVEHRPLATASEVGILSFNNDMTHDFGYSCFMPQTIEIENYYLHNENSNSNEGVYKVIKYTDNFDSSKDYLYKVRFPREIRLKNLRNSDSTGFRVWGGAIAPFYAQGDFGYEEREENYGAAAKNLIIKHNCLIELDNVQLTKIDTANIDESSNNVFLVRGLGRGGDDTYTTVSNRVVPQIIVKNCKDVCISVVALPCILNVYRSTVKAANCMASGSRSIAHFECCVFDAKFPGTDTLGYRFNAVTTDFIGCYFDKPTYVSEKVSSETIQNAYSFLSYSSVNSSDSSFRAKCSFANCRIHPDIEPKTLFPALNSFNYEFNSAQGMKSKK